jgi:hypothetical protein
LKKKLAQAMTSAQPAPQAKINIRAWCKSLGNDKSAATTIGSGDQIPARLKAEDLIYAAVIRVCQGTVGIRTLQLAPGFELIGYDTLIPTSSKSAGDVLSYLLIYEVIAFGVHISSLLSNMFFTTSGLVSIFAFPI